MSVMTVRELVPTDQLSRSVSFWDPSSGTRIEAHAPSARPDLWHRYVEGVTRSYRRYGVERALDLESFADGASTSLFFVAMSSDAEVVAGLRVHGRLSNPGQAHAMLEYAPYPELAAKVEAIIDDRLPLGVLEIKGVWVAPDVRRHNRLSNAIARCYLHAMALLNAQFAFCTAGRHAAARWRGAGGQVVTALPPIPYPDERYETFMLWWDAARLDLADPDQLRRFRNEAPTGSPPLDSPSFQAITRTQPRG